MPRAKRLPEPDATVIGPDQAAAVLRDHAALWDAVQRVSGEYIAVVDREGLIRLCNRVDSNLTVEEVIGKSIARFTEPDSSARLMRALHDVFTDGAPRTLETTVRIPDGNLRYFALRLGPVRSGEHVMAVMVCCEDVYQLKRSEQSLLREQSVLRRLLQIQERERQLVSYEIHDGLAQYLAGAMMHLQACRHAATGHGGRELDEGIRLLQAAAEESRRLIGGLRPPALDELGIVDAIEALVSEARVQIDTVIFRHALPGPRLPPELETTLFRIVQEALSNVCKHAGARTARVELIRGDADVRALVVDDGCGFDPARVPDDRFGLEGIRQRARLFDGQASIVTAVGSGTSVEVTFPLPAAPAE